MVVNTVSKNQKNVFKKHIKSMKSDLNLIQNTYRI